MVKLIEMVCFFGGFFWLVVGIWLFFCLIRKKNNEDNFSYYNACCSLFRYLSIFLGTSFVLLVASCFLLLGSCVILSPFIFFSDFFSFLF